MWLHLIEADAAAAEQIGCRIVAIAIVQRQIRAMVARRRVTHQHGRGQMPIEMSTRRLLLLLLLLWLADEEDDDARNGGRRRANIIAGTPILQRVIIKKGSEGHANEHGHRLDAAYKACKREVLRKH